MLHSDFKEFSRLARGHTLVPVIKSVAADLLTPVSAFMAIAGVGGQHMRSALPDAFLFESVERGEQVGRYTFLGCKPYMTMEASGTRAVITRGKKREHREGRSVDILKSILDSHRAAAIPGLPPFSGGAVGYFSYDSVRQLENIGNRAKDDLHLKD